MLKLLFTALACCLLIGCASHGPYMSFKSKSELAQGQRYFNDGFYKRSMGLLLPLACDGNPEAQYAVGYMYYYGYGVSQDTEVGYFWICRSAEHGYIPAQKALEMIGKEKDKDFKLTSRYR